MLSKKYNSKSGVTMVELVIVLAIMGILAVTVIPMYSQMQAKSQFTRNRANMEIIKDAFLNHFYHTYSMGTPAVPTPPDSLMTDEWCNTPMDSTKALKHQMIFLEQVKFQKILIIILFYIEVGLRQRAMADKIE